MRPLHARAPSVDGRRRLIERVCGDGDTTVLLYAGRLAPEKNLPLLLDTMELLTGNFRLAIAGEGILLSSLRAACESRHLKNVVFLGHVGIAMFWPNITQMRTLSCIPIHASLSALHRWRRWPPGWRSSLPIAAA